METVFEKKYENMRKNLINEAKKIAIMSLKNFFHYLDLNPDAFEHIYNIPIKTEVLDSALAQYFPDEFLIVINTEYLDEQLNYINSNPSLKSNYILEIAVTLVHEYLHANRTIMINNGLAVNTNIEKRAEVLTKLKNIKEGHDLSLYSNLLIDALSKGYDSEFKKYIPLKVIKNSDGMSVIVYNCDTNNYDEFRNIDFEIYDGDNLSEFIHEIAKKLNNLNEKYESYTTIKSFFKSENDDAASVTIPDYIHQSNSQFINIDSIKPKISEEEYQFIKRGIENTFNKNQDKLKYQDAFEEIFVEVLSNIIVMSRNNKCINISEQAAKIINSESISQDEQIGAKLISKLDIEVFRWFMTSAYESCYDDRMSKIFEEEYDMFLLYMSKLYNLANDESEYDISELENIEKIIEKKLVKK